MAKREVKTSSHHVVPSSMSQFERVTIEGGDLSE